MEVHPPHHPLHSWKDFWLHLGTITVGLLIAIGLEQSVEAVHHRHQRQQLEEDLHDEAVQNRDRLAINKVTVDREMLWLLKLRRDVDLLRAGGDRKEFVYPGMLDGYPDDPNRSSYKLLAITVWGTAKESGAVELLPRDEARSYNELYRQIDLTTDRYLIFADKWTEMMAYEFQFTPGPLPGAPNVQKMSAQQLDAYVDLLGKAYFAGRVEKRRLKMLEAYNQRILAGRFDGSIVPADEYLRAHPDPELDLSAEPQAASQH